LIAFRIAGLLAAVVVTALLIASPEFLVLSASCMLEIPSLALAIAAVCLLLTSPANDWNGIPISRPRVPSRFPFREIFAGALFGTSLLIKLVPVILLPLAALILWLRGSTGFQRASSGSIPAPRSWFTSLPLRQTIASLAILGISIAITFVGLDLLIERGAYIIHFGQSWSSHFGGAKSTEYGSPND